jgi:hypothetical protein
MESDGFCDGGGVNFADGLLHLLAAAEFDEGLVAGFFGGHALSDVGLSKGFDVMGDFAVDVV